MLDTPWAQNSVKKYAFVRPTCLFVCSVLFLCLGFFFSYMLLSDLDALHVCNFSLLVCFIHIWA